MAAPLTMWVVYDRPADFPGLFVARRFMVTADGAQATATHFTSVSLDGVRAQLPAGLACLSRAPGDVPSVVEVWL